MYSFGPAPLVSPHVLARACTCLDGRRNLGQSSAFGLTLVTAGVLVVRRALLGLVAVAGGPAGKETFSCLAAPEFSHLTIRSLSRAAAFYLDKLIFDDQQIPALSPDMRPRRALGANKSGGCSRDSDD